jgi:hypothetical protein
VPEANKVGKLRDRGYMDLGYSGFVNDVDMKKEWMPQPRATWVDFPGKRRPSRMMTKKSMYMLETKALYNYQRNKE